MMANKRRSAAPCCCTHSWPRARHRFMRIRGTSKLEREQKSPPQLHTCGSFSPICLLSLRPFCVRSEYAIQIKLFVWKLRLFFFFDRKKKIKRKEHLLGYDMIIAFRFSAPQPKRAKRNIGKLQSSFCTETEVRLRHISLSHIHWLNTSGYGYA